MRCESRRPYFAGTCDRDMAGVIRVYNKDTKEVTTFALCWEHLQSPNTNPRIHFKK